MFSERLRQLREERGLSQNDVAEVLGVERTRYGKWECKGFEPSYDVLIKLADYFDVSLDFLLDREVANEAKINFGKRLAYERKKLGLSQNDLAAALGTTQTAVAKQETGRNYPSIEALISYADFFKCSTDYLLGRKYDANKEAMRAAVEAVQKALEDFVIEMQKEIGNACAAPDEGQQ